MNDLLKEAREAFELCVQHEAENRAEALDDIRFARLGEQWPEQVRKRREVDGRPCLTINRLPAFIRQGNTLLAQALAGIDPTKPAVVNNG